MFLFRDTMLSFCQYCCLLFAVLVTVLPLWAVMVYNSFGNTMRLQYVNDTEQLDLLNGLSSDFGPVKMCWYNYNVVRNVHKNALKISVLNTIHNKNVHFILCKSH